MLVGGLRSSVGGFREVNQKKKTEAKIVLPKKVKIPLICIYLKGLKI